MVLHPFQFQTPWPLALATVVAFSIVAIGVSRRLRLDRRTKSLAVAGLIAAVLAAGSPVVVRPVLGSLIALIDVSASTRSANYRDVARLRQRIAALAGDRPVDVRVFAGPTADPMPADLRDSDRLADRPGSRTLLPAVAADGVLLFSDGRFELPSFFPPTWPVIDEGIAAAADARVVSLETDGRSVVARSAVSASLADEPNAKWFWQGPVSAPLTERLVAGDAFAWRNLSGSPAESAVTVAARVEANDAWPENDAMRIVTPPRAGRNLWYVSTDASVVPEGFTHLSPGQLPTDLLSYAGVDAIVLANVAAQSSDGRPLLPDAALTRFVRDAGGGLVVTGGNHAFAAGGYTGTRLDAALPLQSAPPTPAGRWIVLLDASGSMAAAAPGGGTRWQSVATAIARILPTLPPNDRLSVGGFSASLHWWLKDVSLAAGNRVGDLLSKVNPGGPTNLQSALHEVWSDLGTAGRIPDTPIHVVILTDADVDLRPAHELADDFSSHGAKLFVLALGDGKGIIPLRAAAEATGGKMLKPDRIEDWTASAGELFAAARPAGWFDTPMSLVYLPAWRGLPSVLPQTLPTTSAADAGRRLDGCNPVWLRPNGTAIAARIDGESQLPIAAWWQLGEGKVVAAGFVPTPDELTSVIRRVRAGSHDPRFAVRWDLGREIVCRVSASAVDGSAEPLNGLPLSLSLRYADEDGESGGTTTGNTSPPQTNRSLLDEGVAFEQVGPGDYRVSIPSLREPVLAVVRLDGRIIDRHPIAGRYDPEFDGIGLNRPTLVEMTHRFGGAVIEPTSAGPIDFKSPLRQWELGGWCAAASVLLLAAAIVIWRLTPPR